MPVYHYRPRNTDQSFVHKVEADTLDAAIKYIAKIKDLSETDFIKLYEVRPNLDKELNTFVGLSAEYDRIQKEANNISLGISKSSNKLERLLIELKQLRKQENQLYADIALKYDVPVESVKKEIINKLIN